MRLSSFARLVALGFVVVAPMQVMAQGMVVSAFNCRQTLPCDGNDPQFPSTDKLIADASACASHYMPTIQGVDIFNDISGLGNDGCLTTNPAAFTKGQGATMPHCCIHQNTSGQCAVHCDIITQ